MRLVRPSGVRTLDMHARALEIKTQGVELFLNSFKKLNRWVVYCQYIFPDTFVYPYPIFAC